MMKTIRMATTALVTSAALLAPMTALAADFVLKMSSPAPMSPVDPLSAWLEAFEQGVEARSEGRIDVQLYPASQLGPIPATIEGVMMGTIEVTMPVIGFLSGIEPRYQVLDAAGLFDSEAHALRTLMDPEVRSMLSEFGEDAGVEPLFVLTSGRINIVSRDPITTVADFEGLKMRTGGATALVNLPMERLGVSPISLSLGDVLPGIQTGTIDASLLNMPVSVGFNFADVARESVYLPGKFGIVSGIISRDFLATVGPELAAIIREEAAHANEAYASRLESGPAALESAWVAAGGHLNEFSQEEHDALLAATVATVEEVIAADPQMQADYDILIAAAERARAN